MSRPQNAAQIAASIDQASLPSTQAAPTRPMAVDPGTRQVLDDLFVRLKGVFPGWRASWPTPAEEGAAKREWLAMFVAAGINRIEQIQHGVRMAREYSRGGDKERGYLPTPGMFVKWCHAPEAFGLPPLERAYAQAMRNTHVAQAADARWSHAALYHAAKACGYSNLQSLKRADGLKLFDKHYSAVCQRLARGEVLEPAPIAALPAPLKKGSAAVANAALAALRCNQSKPQQQVTEHGYKIAEFRVGAAVTFAVTRPGQVQPWTYGKSREQVSELIQKDMGCARG